MVEVSDLDFAPLRRRSQVMVDTASCHMTSEIHATHRIWLGGNIIYFDAKCARSVQDWVELNLACLPSFIGDIRMEYKRGSIWNEYREDILEDREMLKKALEDARHELAQLELKLTETQRRARVFRGGLFRALARLYKMKEEVSLFRHDDLQAILYANPQDTP